MSETAQGGHFLMQDVVRQYEASLVRYAARITGDAELARDVAQDVFLRLCREDPAELNGRLRPWLYAVCRNRAIELSRKRHRSGGSRITPDPPLPTDRRGLEPGDAGSEAQSRPRLAIDGIVQDRIAQDRSVDPAEAIEAAESKSRVLQLLEELSPNQQDVIRLRFEHGLSYKEIAAVLDLTVSNVGVLIHTAIKTLRERMGE